MQAQLNAEAENEAQFGGLLEGTTYQFEGQKIKDGESNPIAFAFTVEAGGSLFFQGEPSGADGVRTNVNGVIVNEKITLTVQFEEESI